MIVLCQSLLSAVIICDLRYLFANQTIVGLIDRYLSLQSLYNIVLK